MVAFTEEVARKIALQERDPWIEVEHDLVCLQHTMVNVALFGPPNAGDRGWVLIDAGLRGSAPRIFHAARRRFGEHARPSAIILTHGHFDHVGSLLHLAEFWDVPVYAHPLEMPYLTGRSAYPPPDPLVGGGAMSLLSPLYSRGPIDISARLQPLPSNHCVPGMLGWQWIHTPGHTPGHVSLFRNRDRTLIAGDAFVTTKQESMIAALLQPEHVHRPPAYYTIDWQSAHRSIIELTMLDPETVLAGHGKPMRGQVLRDQLQQLARGFSRHSVPKFGRYSKSPARTDENGVVWVPPPQLDAGKVLAGVALGAIAIAGMVLAVRAARRSLPTLQHTRNLAVSP